MERSSCYSNCYTESLMRPSEKAIPFLHKSSPTGADLYLRLFAPEVQDLQHEDLLLQIETYIHQNIDKFERDDNTRLEAFFDALHSFYLQEKSTLKRGEQNWLRHKIRQLHQLVRVEERHVVLQSVKDQYLKSNQASIDTVLPQVNALQTNYLQQGEEIDRQFHQQLQLISQQHGVSIFQLVSLGEETDHNLQAAAAKVVQITKEKDSQHAQNLVRFEQQKQAILDENGLDLAYLDMLQQELHELSGVIDVLQNADLGTRDKYFENDKVSQRQSYAESFDPLGEDWTYALGDYDHKMELVSTIEGSKDKKEPLENAEQFVIHRIEQLLAETSKRPIVVVDFGGAIGVSMHKIAQRFSREIAEGNVVLIVTNYATNQADMISVIHKHPKLNGNENLRQQMLQNVDAGLIRYVMADAQELGTVPIQNGDTQKTLADVEIDVLLENLSFVAHSPRVDWDTQFLQPLFSQNGLMVSLTRDAQLGYPLTTEAIFGRGGRSESPATKAKAPEHPYRLILNQGERSDQSVPELSLVRPRLLNALNAMRTLSTDFVRLEEAQVPETPSQAVKTPPIWVRKGALPLEIHDEDDEVVVTIQTDRNHYDPTLKQALEAGDQQPGILRHLVRQLLGV